MDAKDILQKEIKKAKNEFVKDKLELKNDIEPEEESEEENKEE